MQGAPLAKDNETSAGSDFKAFAKDWETREWELAVKGKAGNDEALKFHQVLANLVVLLLKAAKPVAVTPPWMGF